MNRERLPDDDELARLIATSFDALPGPDNERLAVIGKRLEAQLAGPRKRRHNRWLWLWLLLAGGTVTAAAWWVSDVIQREKATVSRQSAPITNGNGAGVTDAKDNSANNVAGEKNELSRDHKPDPVIYQREAQ